MLADDGLVAEFLVEGLLRGDTTSRYGACSIAIDKGFLTVDEVRRFESLAPLNA
jgi:hypothetical protein